MKPLQLMALLEAYSITGPAKNLLEFARLAREAGVETTVVTFVRQTDPENDGKASNLFIETARNKGIAVEAVVERSPYDAAARTGIRKIAERLRPDVIQTHAVKSHFLARLARLPELAPWVAFHHGYTWPTLKARLYNQLDRWSLRTAHQVLTVSQPFREELVANGVPRERVTIIHNAIPPDWGTRARSPEQSAALRHELGIAPHRKVVLIVGRLSREKDHLTLLEAVHRIKDEVPVHLLIVGEGPERPQIEEKIRNLNMGNAVTLTGQQNSAEPFYGIADLAVLSSLSEGSPNALLEAMAAGVPAVATAVGGIPEIVTDRESALLVKARDITGMGDAIRLVLTDDRLAAMLTKRAKNLIETRHTPEHRVNTLVSTYQMIKRQAKVKP